MQICGKTAPEWQEVTPGHWCACHLYNMDGLSEEDKEPALSTEAKDT